MKFTPNNLIRVAGRLALVALVPVLARPAIAGQDFVARFDRLDNQLNGGLGYVHRPGNTSGYAWGESYLMSAYVTMYRATSDTHFLDKLVDHFDRVLANRDDVRHLKDQFTNQELAGWGSSEYSKGKWHVWAVHTGMICLGPVDFVGLVKAEAKLKAKYSKKADEYLAKIKECVGVFDKQWRPGPGVGEGSYLDQEVGLLPLNQQNALGSVMVELYLITRDHTYKDRATQLAKFMMNRVRKNADGSYDWSYWPKPDRTSSGSEDISHAAINIEFAVRCKAAHIVLKDTDMHAFGLTWTNHIHRGEGEFADTVNGSGGPNTHSPQAVGRWVVLAGYEKTIFEDARIALGAMDDDKAGGAELLGIANLARFNAMTGHKRGFRLPRIKLFPRKGGKGNPPQPDTEI
ncbi:MAG: hypothetical protein ABJA67_12550 [Chthonomonadales bacterium]